MFASLSLVWRVRAGLACLLLILGGVLTISLYGVNALHQITQRVAIQDGNKVLHAQQALFGLNALARDIYPLVNGAPSQSDIDGLRQHLPGYQASIAQALDTLQPQLAHSADQAMLAAIDANFEGYDDVRALLRSAPCYGNNDEYADAIGREIDKISVEYGGKYSMKELGIHNDVRYVPFTSHVPFGKVVSATPNGRTDGFPLSDGSSASHGADVNGPTAVLLSNYQTKNMGMRDRAARMLNIKFTPKCVEGEQGTEKLVSFIRTFCDLKLWHVQFNVVNKQTLVAAQKDPQKYRNLIVRIAGYSAYFVDLSPDLQNDLIARTEHDVM